VNNLSFIRRPSEAFCPGIQDFVRPTVSYEVCKKCGGRVEVWSDEDEGVCLDCGAKWERKEKMPSCLDYCEYADKCKGIIMSKKR
jgi:A2L zinc ribbon domain